MFFPFPHANITGAVGGQGAGSNGLTAPTLAWDNETTDATPDLTVDFDDTVGSGDNLRFEYGTDSGFAGATVVNHSITGGEDTANTLALALSALANGTYYVRVRTEKSGVGVSGWSNTVTMTIAHTAPVLSNPVGTKTGSTTASLTVDTTINDGTIYWVVTTSATSPTATQVKTGKDHTGASASASGSQATTGTGTNTMSPAATGLTASTTYYAHYVQQDTPGNFSNVSDSSSFTTDSASSFAYIGRNSNASGGASATFTGQAVGAAGAGRLIVIGVMAASFGANQTISGVTCNGNAMTRVGTEADVSAISCCLFQIVEPLGTTADFVITVSTSISYFGITVYSLFGYNSTATSTAKNSAGGATSLSTSSALAVPASGVGVIFGTPFGGSANPVWGAGTSDDGSPAYLAVGSNATMIGGHATSTGSYTPSMTWTGNNQVAMVAAAWGP